MADTKVPATGPKQKLPAIPDIESPLPNEKVWEYRRRVLQAQINKGSRYPPFSIEPMPWERQRINSPMSEEDRFLRKQWLRDQNLSPNEPRNVPEAKPMFRARRLIRIPWDMAEVVMAKVIGQNAAGVIRLITPKILFAYVLGVAGFYHIYYNPRSWESHHGFFLFGSRRSRFPGADHSAFPPDVETFNLQGFDYRKSHLNARTSAQGQ
ncbi:uncharacterized protein LOC123524966 [Mercenaria mercenaria]|uniref:uncharacterized protein LOC123524966 n=1 Tax=Mercenaria mercenaria TaxID=6596 RepID=UPI00234EEA57|nr:uncharacterized protein LOC123524966 [Mercenaria mercenaria]